MVNNGAVLNNELLNALTPSGKSDIILQALISSGIIGTEDVAQANIVSLSIKLKEKGIDTKKIKYRESNHQYYISLNRQIARDYDVYFQQTAKSESQLITKLAKIFLDKNPKDLTLEEAFEEVEIYRFEVIGLSNKTLKEDQCEWNRFFRDSIIASMPLKQITVDDITELFLAITKGHAISRKRFISAKSVLNNVFKHYKSVLHHNPIDDFDDSLLKGRFKSGDENLDNYYTDEDIVKLNSYLLDKNDPYSIAIRFSMNVALRIGEIRALKFSDYDPEKSTLKIVRSTRREPEVFIGDDGKLTIGSIRHVTESRLKGNRTESKRCIILTDDAQELIELSHKLNPDGIYLFEYRGKQLSYDTFNNHLKEACLAVGIRYRSSHKMRFHGASKLFDAIGLEKTSSYLGHSTTAQTLHYIKKDRLEPDDAVKIKEALTIKPAI